MEMEMEMGRACFAVHGAWEETNQSNELRRLVRDLRSIGMRSKS